MMLSNGWWEQMQIDGIQKLTLLDYSGYTACTIFLGGCNFRCPFCHNASLVYWNGQRAAMQEDEFFAFLEKRRGILDGVCISGGEPMMHPHTESLVRRIKEKGYLVKLDTNGSFPEKLGKFLNERLLDYVAMDIKNSKEKYRKTAGAADLDLGRIEESRGIIMDSKISYEFRTTLVKELHQMEDVEEMARWIAGADAWYLQAFVDSGDVLMEGLHAHSKEWMEKAAALAAPYVECVEIRGVE